MLLNLIGNVLASAAALAARRVDQPTAIRADKGIAKGSICVLICRPRGESVASSRAKP
jgi:hypothetical protein